MMIARMWEGRTRSEQADKFEAYVLATGVPGIRQTPGNCAVFLMRRALGDETEFVVLSLWESWDAIHAFAGDRVELARYYRDDGVYLLEMNAQVQHFDVIVPGGLAETAG
jgi:heme-degrading monooxygenase HmoA